MTRKDLPYVLAIERRSFPNPWSPAVFEGEIDNVPISNPNVIIYQPVRQIIGYVNYWIRHKESQISNIAVHPRFRRQGVGEEALHRIMVRLRHQGIWSLILEVRSSNKAARALYEKLGFRLLGVYQDYYSLPIEDALVMGKAL